MHPFTTCVVIIIPLVGGIATVVFAVLLTIALLNVDPDGLGPPPLDQARWDLLAMTSLPLAAIGGISVLLGLVNLRHGRMSE
jgi:hypothetical protein